MRLEKLNSLSLLWGIPSKEGLKKIKKTNSVFIPEMRPYILGLKVAAGLNKEGVKPIYVTDNMLGLLFYKQKIKEVLFFYKKMENGHFLGICGSLCVCLLSHLHQVPIKALKGKEIDLRVFDQDASTIDGCLFFKNAALEAKDEYVPMELIK